MNRERYNRLKARFRRAYCEARRQGYPRRVCDKIFQARIEYLRGLLDPAERRRGDDGPPRPKGRKSENNHS